MWPSGDPQFDMPVLDSLIKTFSNLQQTVFLNRIQTALLMHHTLQETEYVGNVWLNHRSQPH